MKERKKTRTRLALGEETHDRLDVSCSRIRIARIWTFGQFGQT